MNSDLESPLPLPPVADEAAAQAAYEEYVRGFDDIPILQDAVHAPPRPRPQPDFRRGERRDARKAPRPDAYTVREEVLAELERLYAEYCGVPGATASAAKPAKRKTAARKPRAKRRSSRAKASGTSR